MNIKILVVYHKNGSIVRDDVFTPILVGASKIENKQDFKDFKFFDNDGENISDKNGLYNELTAIYWAWKNYDKLGNPDYIGLCHYRRFFVFENSKNPYREIKEINDGFFDTIKYNNDSLITLLSESDFVAPIPSSRQSVRLNYARAHNIEDLNCVQRIIDERHPEYSKIAQSYFDGNKAYFHNMFIFDKSTFFEYCEWLFDILFEFERTATSIPDRMFISERLTGVFLAKLEQDGKQGAFLPTLYITEPKLALKVAIEKTKLNLRLKNSSKLYALKPLIVYFTPNFILKMRRSKRYK